MIIVAIDKESQAKMFESLTPEQKNSCFHKVEEGQYIGYTGIKFSLPDLEEICIIVDE